MTERADGKCKWTPPKCKKRNSDDIKLPPARLCRINRWLLCLPFQVDHLHLSTCRLVFNCSPLCSVTTWKKANEPTRGSFRWRISWKSSSGWLLGISHFGTEQGGAAKNHAVYSNEYFGRCSHPIWYYAQYWDFLFIEKSSTCPSPFVSSTVVLSGRTADLHSCKNHKSRNFTGSNTSWGLKDW